MQGDEMVQQELLQFGLRVKALRTALGISQEQLGLIAELDRTYISGIERGIRNVSLLNIHRIARALQVPIVDLCIVAEVQQ
ncbi:helix-turn-helix domain-containing protein [Undibacterium luofuense]|uniref:Helix-turn-helix transcriptional regulator n=1 Tax=Undibacterium luofuense TaxID=2828733 RepID=A0A941DMG6_9BURK|nr:helix-turn-helix transcriptional regulator [Undibacterium luofuense]MBR7782344.1 helix-turn-helix transcriptional regulator [Undibacterium luofuense]